jgi:DNA-binding response OmpR family regulator
LIALPRETATVRHNSARLPMRTGSDVLLFGPFELHSARRRLMRGRERVPLPDSYVNPLLLFASHAGEIISKDSLAKAGW